MSDAIRWFKCKLKPPKNGCHFVNIDCTENIQITDPEKNWVSGFPSVNRNGISVSAIMKKIEKWLSFHKYQSYRKISNYWPPPPKNKLGHLCMVTFLHLENQRCKFSIDSIFWTFCWFSFPPTPILGSISTFKTFMRGDLSTPRVTYV